MTASERFIGTVCAVIVAAACINLVADIRFKIKYPNGYTSPALERLKEDLKKQIDELSREEDTEA